MELGQYQLQIFVSLTVILGAAFVALICDFLKGNNEQLRELTIELRVRREEEQRRQPLTPAIPAAAAPEIAAPAMAQVAPALAASLATSRAMGEKHGKRTERKRAVNSEAMAAMERGAALASTGGRPRTAAAEAKPMPAVVETEKVKVVVAAAKKDWGSLLSCKPQMAGEHSTSTASHDLLAAVVAATNSGSSSEASLPAGFQDGYVLRQLVQSHQPVSGLVVSIGVNASQKGEGALPESINRLVQSLLGPNDFAAQSSEDEFLLICPEERGASAQRRLSQIAQQLWDFQLRSLGSFQILFSWGGVEVRSESIDEAIASASERMQETNRGRKLITMASPGQASEGDKQLRHAV